MLVVRKMVKPADLAGHQNGTLDTSIMRKVAFAGRGKLGTPAYGYLHHLCADAWEAMVFECERETGYTLTATDWLRYLASQTGAFFERYVDTYSEAVCSADHEFKFKRFYLGKWWWLRRGKIPCAVPGTSPHGHGLATDGGVWIDIDFNGMKETINYFDRRLKGVVKNWLLANVERFGFSWAYAAEGADDPHLQYWAGDNIPPAVLAFLALPDNTSEPSLEDEMQLIQVKDDTAVYCRDGSTCTWVRDGVTVGELQYCGQVAPAPPTVVTKAVIGCYILKGPEPVYATPPLVGTSGADFAFWDR